MDITRTEQYKQWQAEMKHYQNLTAKRHITETKAQQERRKNRARKDYAYFVETYFPDTARSKCGKFQVEAAEYILKHKNARAVFEWARGHAKSTHLGVLVPLWLKIQDERQFNTMVVVSKSEDSAVRLLADLQQQLAYNELYIHDFGTQMKSGNWAEGEFITADNCYFVALGRGQSPRGLKNDSHRPDYIVIDDIDDDQMCKNPQRVADATEWVLSALFGTMEAGRGRFVLVGNKIAKNSILANVSERPNVFHTIVNILDKDGKPTWKENYKLKEVQEMRQMMGERNFEKEYMNNPLVEGAIFLQKHIKYGPILPLRQYRKVVCYTDPSFKSSATADYKATVLAGVTADGHFHIIKVYADQTSVSAMIEWHYEIMRWIAGRVPVQFYMESNFMQDLILDEFRKAGDNAGIHIPIIGDSRKKPDKFARIESMQPLFERGLVVINELEKQSNGVKILIEQLLMFQHGSHSHDDAPDALESCIWMLSRTCRTNASHYVKISRTTRRY